MRAVAENRWRWSAATLCLFLVAWLVACGGEADLGDAPSSEVPPVQEEAGPGSEAGDISPEDEREEPDGAHGPNVGGGHAPDGEAEGDGEPASAAGLGPRPGGGGSGGDDPVATPVRTGSPPTFALPDSIRGIYLNAWAAGSPARSEALIDLARRTELNSFVIDLKDASGYVSHRTAVPLAREVGADGEIRIRNIEGLLDRLHEAGIYPIARIVVFQDPILAERRDLAILDEDARVWIDGGGKAWVNPYDRTVWDYNIALAREAAELGFPEVQWDYVRFPDAPASELERLVFPHAEGRTRSAAIREFLTYAREELADLDLRLTADVFGVATSATTDVGIGQLWEDFIDVVDVALPMVYPSHYWSGSFGIDEPNAHPYEVVHAAMSRALERSEKVKGAGEVIPWLQDFTLGAPRYGAPEVRAQIQATYDLGIPHWILWNASSRYTEEALAPAEGFPAGTDPLIRMGDRIVPASLRFVPPDTVSVDAGPLPLDSLGIDTLPRDTLPRDPIPGDTIRGDTLATGTDTDAPPR